MGKYEEPEAGEWVQPTPESYKFQCCDCGLVHRLDFRITTVRTENEDWVDRIQFRAYRDNRATAAVRRERRKRGETWR